MWKVVAGMAGINISQFEMVGIKRKNDLSKGPLRVNLIRHSRRSPVKLQLFIKTGDPSPWETIGLGREINSYALTDPCVESMLGWLQDCTMQSGLHKECQRPQVPNLPSRVIKIGSADTELRLYIAHPSEKARYVALSHCWGGSSSLITTQANLFSHIQKIPDQNLPQTFRDAITVTRRLGVSYLWIDSICIIQDSNRDWATESAHMGSIYENAFVTIAADAATDSTTGFLNPPARRPAPSINVKHKGKVRTKSCIYVREKGMLAWQLPYHGWSSGHVPLPNKDWNPKDVPMPPPRSKLSTRGWVFQERIMAPRTLHFAEFELAWECRSVISCECSATSERESRGGSLLKGSLARQSWKQLVQEYSALDLTFQTDRLPAIAGLAEAMNRARPGDEYFCGVWKSQLVEQLLWLREVRSTDLTRERESRRFESYYAPTWSWASITGQVLYKNTPDLKISGTLNILDVQCQARLNQYGPVSTAYLLLSGLTVRVKLTQTSAAGKISPRSIRPTQYTGPKDLHADAVLDINAGEHVFHQSEHDEGLLFLLIAGGTGAPHGLLLLPAGHQDGEDQVVERVGYGYVMCEIAKEDRYSSDDDSDVEWDAKTAASKWQDWADIAERRRLKLV